MEASQEWCHPQNNLTLLLAIAGVEKLLHTTSILSIATGALRERCGKLLAKCT